MADTENDDININQQALDDLTVLQNIAAQTMGEARLNANRPNAEAGTDYGRLGDIIPGTAGDHGPLDPKGIVEAGVAVEIDQAPVDKGIAPIETIELESQGNLMSETIASAPPKVEIKTRPEMKVEEKETVEEVSQQTVPTGRAPESATVTAAPVQSAPDSVIQEAAPVITEEIEEEVNQAPILDADDVATSDDHSAVEGQISTSDPDGDAVSVYLIDPVTGEYVTSITTEYGTVVINTSTGEYTFTPNDEQAHLGVGESHHDSFQAVAVDARGLASAPIDVGVTITGSNDGPTISEASDFDGGTRYEYDRTEEGRIVASDIDSTDTLTYSIVDDRDHHGTLEINASTGEYVYTATDSTFTGEDVFTVQVSDGNGGVVHHQITINDQGMNVIEVDFTREVSVETQREVTVREESDLIYHTVSETETVVTAANPIYHTVTTTSTSQEAAEPIYHDVTTTTTTTEVDARAMIESGAYEDGSGQWIRDVTTTTTTQETVDPIYKEVTHTNTTQEASEVVYKTVTDTTVTHEVDTEAMVASGAYVNLDGEWVKDVTDTVTTQQEAEPIYHDVTTTTTTTELDTEAMVAEGGYQTDDGEWVRDVTTTTTTQQPSEIIYKMVPVDDDHWYSGNNGWGNGDQDAPGSSGGHNNAENNSDGHSGGGEHDKDKGKDGHSGGGSGGGSSGGSGGGSSGGEYQKVVDVDAMIAAGNFQTADGTWVHNVTTTTVTAEPLDLIYHDVTTTTTTTELDVDAMIAAGNYQTDDGQWVHDESQTTVTQETVPVEYHDVVHEVNTQVVDTDAMTACGNYQNTDGQWVHNVTTTSTETVLDTDAMADQGIYQSADGQWVHDVSVTTTTSESVEPIYHDVTTTTTTTELDTQAMEEQGIYQDADGQWVHDVTTTTTTTELDTQAMADSGAYQDETGQWVVDSTVTTTYDEVDTQAMADGGNYYVDGNWFYDETSTVTEVTQVIETSHQYVSLDPDQAYDDTYHLLVMESSDGQADWTAVIDEPFDFAGHDVVQNLDPEVLLHATSSEDHTTLFVDNTNNPPSA